MVTIDTTIPGSSAEIVDSDVVRPSGTSGRIAIVGKFERGDANRCYFFANPRTAGRVLGTSESYGGSKMIDFVFKQDTENENYGASSIIAVKAGASVVASLNLLDASSATVLPLVAVGAGLWANGATGGLKASVATGTISGKRLTVKLNNVIVEDYDNCSNEDLMNKLNGYSQYINCPATSAELARTLANISDAAFTGGTETATPTTSDLTAALAVLTQEDFDAIIFTDAPDPAYFPTILAWLNTKLSINKPTRTRLPILTTNTVTQAMSIAATTDSPFISYLYQYFTIDNDTLNVAESIARYEGFIAGMPVFESPTNKVINDIDDLNAVFSKGNTGDEYNLTDAGIDVFALKSRENSKFGIVSAVTPSTKVDETGRKTGWSALHAVRSFIYAMKRLNVDDYQGQTGISDSIDALQGELSNRVTALVDEKIVNSSNDLIATASTDPDDESVDIVAEVDVSMRPKGILKHIHYRYKQLTGGS